MPVPQQMSGVLLTAHGGPECLEWRDDLPVPVPGTSEVLIEVAAAGVNNTDINTRIGWYDTGDDPDGDIEGWSGTPFSLPRIQGADVCGRIVAVGPGVESSRIGERVIVEPCLTEARGTRLDPPWYFGSECDGGFAEYTCVAARHAVVVESPLTDVELASFPCSASTAENLLTRASVAAGDHVVVTGASGGVGSAAVQLAAARGARVTAIVSSAKADDIVSLGATDTLDRDADLVDEIGRATIDVVVDVVGGPGWPALIDTLRPHGRYAVSGAIAGATVDLDLRTLYLRDLSFFGCTVLEPGVFAALVRRIEAGDLTPTVAATHPLSEIAAAQREFQAKRHTGKIVLEVGGPDAGEVGVR